MIFEKLLIPNLFKYEIPAIIKGDRFSWLRDSEFARQTLARVNPVNIEILKFCGICSPSYGGDDEAFLRKIITPIYRVIEKESKKSQNGKAPHSAWCNYDDLNEYFWTADCFRLGWPMHDDSEFFKSTRDKGKHHAKSGSTGKSYFVETRTFWHISAVLTVCGPFMY